MPSFFVHHGSPTTSTHLVAEPAWALAVRSMVGRHDAGGMLAQRLATSFSDLIRSRLAAGDGPHVESLHQQRERIASIVRATAATTEAQGDDGVFFTLFVAAANAVRVFNIGPQRTFLASCNKPVTVLAPQSVAEEARRAAVSVRRPDPGIALIGTGIGHAEVNPTDIDAIEIEIPVHTWLVAHLDDRVSQPTLSVPLRSASEMLQALRTNAEGVRNFSDNWLLASSSPWAGGLAG